MENASKALLIAGSVLLTMIIVGLAIFAWGKFSDFYNKNDDLSEIEDLTKFNLQFTNYEGRDVYGYELISLANKVADYNFKHSNAQGAQNDEKYNPITMSFSMTQEQVDSLKFSKTIPNENGGEMTISANQQLFTSPKYTQSTAEDQIVGNITVKASDIEEDYGSAEIATKLAKSINSLILSKEQFDYNEKNKNMSVPQSKASALTTYNRIVGTDSDKYIEFDNTNLDDINKKYKFMRNSLLNRAANVLKYYEFYQFKRRTFTCTKIEYDDVTGRVSKIEFEYKE